MNDEKLPAWLMSLWSSLVGRRERLPHALLLCGAKGSGKRLFAEHLGRALLCISPGAEGFACGECVACKWIRSGNHPDFFMVVPAADEAQEEETEGAEAGKKEKARSTQIVIDQVRSLQSSLEVGAGGHGGGLRVVIMDPAEAMNVAAANAILKALEEPLAGTLYILLSHAPRRLLPTIRSRCQVIDFPKPDRATALRWMNDHGIKEEALLGFASGLPLAAREYAGATLTEARSLLAQELSRLPETDPLKLAADWEARIKTKAMDEAGFTTAELLAWIQRWLTDGVRVASGLHPSYFEDHEKDLLRLAQGKQQAWLQASRKILDYRRVANHPLNARLFLEDLALQLRRTLG